MEKLKACPFCNSQDVEVSENDFGWRAVRCAACKCWGPEGEDDNDNDAVALWNNRGGDSSNNLAKELQAAIDRGGWDISPCMTCGLPVVCLPDGLPSCEACARKEVEGPQYDAPQ